MIDAGISKLVELGMPLDRIHFDRFTDGPPDSAVVLPATVAA
jgi:hypothetical protein